MRRHLFRIAASLFCLGLAAPAALLAQSKTPDFNGAWAPYRGGRGADPKLAAPAATPILIKPQFVKEYEAKRAADAAAQARGEQIATGAITCQPYGFPAMMSVAVYPLEITQTANQLTMVQEAFSEVRRIYLNKKQDPIDEVPPSFHGRSIGKWEGDTLVVDTVGVKESVRYQNIPHSDQMRITERIRLIAPDILHDQITIEDPVTLEKPYTFTLAYRKLPDYEMVEFVCAENNREYVDENGIVRMRVLEK
jgi:hypothetical protein